MKKFIFFRGIEGFEGHQQITTITATTINDIINPIMDNNMLDRLVDIDRRMGEIIRRNDRILTGSVVSQFGIIDPIRKLWLKLKSLFK